jgi:gas vesicle protein
MDEERRRDRLRSFLIGGVVGASAAIAAARRLSTVARRERETPAGLAAFEGAPCYRELIERERGV